MTLSVVTGFESGGGTARHSDVVADPLSALGARLEFKRDDEIFAQGQDAAFVYRIVRGVVRTTRLADDGRRQVGGFHRASDILGLEDGDQHLFSAEALSDCSVLIIRRRTLEAEAVHNNALAHLLWTAGSRRLREMQSHLVQIGRKSAIERVAGVLADLAFRDGREEVDLPMSRQDIADYLSLTIETVSRMLSQLQARKVIALTSLRRMRVCNPDALSRLAA
jgi:CRP/FNR family nitrogen fixation transcriptional regulator